ncbi:branched-chain amino acid ABC transporter permease [Streptomyces sp. TRM43335]|uniref:Branched-chain amino acid ABC transporter permease n=1 Tax=Streptomyces taklimakanensis TaxID=2569853 RepID=A0A6G2BB38_9ACTN|nr:AzlC family ABC transporter permease [Streptomyces taklimakanensis]MTE19478.1 branched-chain amino acid ABC transporter permease [Streptomyces taklimakanensis]
MRASPSPQEGVDYQQGKGGAAEAVRLTVPVAMAYIPLGVAFGVLLTASGISWYWAPISTLLIYAGSIEFLAVGFMVAGLPIYQVAFTSLIVNFRHIFYGLSFPIERLRTRTQKVYGVFALTDETYGITTAGPGMDLTGRQITILQAVSHVWWFLGALLGSLIGQVIPDSVKGFEFALTAMFLTLAVNAVRSRRSVGLVLLALAAGAIAYFVDKYLIEESFLIVSLLLYVGAISCMYKKEKAK